MLKSYLKIAWRSLVKNKAYSLINISGLSIGMCACLLLLQYVSYELSFDDFHQRGANIYRVRNDRQVKGELVQKGAFTYPFVAPGLKKSFPEVQDYVRIAPWIADHTLIKYGDKVFREKGFLFAESSFFKIFSFPLLHGDPVTALAAPMSIVLSETKAKQIFGNENPIGKTIHFEAKKPFTVTGIFKDVPDNSHIQFNMLASYETLFAWMPDYADSKTFSEEVYTYLLLKSNTDIVRFNSKLKSFSDRYYQGTKVTGMEETFSLQPLHDIHLYSHLQFELQPNGNSFAVWGLFGVAVLIIIIAWCNYINLSTSHYTKRVKEIGIKKVLGVTKNQFLHQFLIESLLVSIVSFFIAFTLFKLCQPLFINLFNLDTVITNSPIYNTILPAAFVAFVAGAIISSFYPSFILSSLKPASIYKGKLNASPGIIMFNKALVIYQFAITIALISFTWVVSKQLKFMTGKDLGVNIDGTLVVWGPMGIEWKGLEKKMNAFENEVKQLPAVKAITNSKNVPGDQLEKIYGVKLTGSNKIYSLASTWVDDAFFDLYKMQVLAGRKFLPVETDKKHLILNKSAVNLLGFDDLQGVIGKKLELWGEEGEVVGVVNDHHQQSLHNLVEPLIFRNAAGQDGYFSIKISNQNIRQTISQIQSVYNDFFKGTSFEYFFLEESFEKQYQNDQLVNKALQYFSLLAIFISCLGLLGLIIHSITTRIKEIGIRRVLGATVLNIILLISKDFIKLLVAASIIATPAAWWVTHLWLENYAYKTEVNGLLFLIVGLMAVVMAILTVGFQTIRAASENPVKSLRTE